MLKMIIKTFTKIPASIFRVEQNDQFSLVMHMMYAVPAAFFLKHNKDNNDKFKSIKGTLYTLNIVYNFG
jgi:hypothetical protein